MVNQYPQQAYQRKLKAIIELAGRWQLRIDNNEWPELDNQLNKFSQFAHDYIKLLERIPGAVMSPQFDLNRGVGK